jgi:4a-hydroxytetrahydrobiopterin dehydratase
MPQWTQIERDGVAMLTRRFAIADWRNALSFVAAVGAVAEAQDHHPEILLTSGAVVVTVWSHDARGLTARDERFCRAVDLLPGADESRR